MNTTIHDPFSNQQFKRAFTSSGGNLQRLTDAIKRTPAVTHETSGKPPVCEGMIIEHDRFGIGTVVKVEGNGENAKATVEFKNVGTKQLLLKFARYKVIG